MHEPNPTHPKVLLKILSEHIQANRADLTHRYRQVLLENLFSSRSELRPAAVGHIASEEVEALFGGVFNPSVANERGKQLCLSGLGLQAILQLGAVTRQFILEGDENEALALGLEVYDRYFNALLAGYVQETESLILSEQERIRGALHRAVSRFTVEIKEVQEMAQKATEANTFKSHFIGRISHEVRTPLGAMVGMADMLLHGVYGTLMPEQEGIIKRIFNNAEMLSDVFTELLDQAQIESGRLNLKAEEFSPRELVEAVQKDCLSLALQKGLSLKAVTAPNLSEVLIGDKMRISQILSNLVINAIKYTNTGFVDVQAYQKDEVFWAMQVKDSGIGIPPEAQSYIFEPYRQVDESLSKQAGGVGLGLAIVKQLVTLMNGTISLQSRVGQGSTFTVFLPLKTTVE